MAFRGGFSMGPNVGEAVNFCNAILIAHLDPRQATRYRSFCPSCTFTSHDRLTFTMGNHLKSQKSHRDLARLLLEELERCMAAKNCAYDETSLLREFEIVPDLVVLPPNRFDQLDEESADYDDKRLCHGCKHVCFFSAVACECSQSKVSCLRSFSLHVSMCRKDRRYLLIWINEKEIDRNNSSCSESFRDSLKTDADNDVQNTVNTKGHAKSQR
jgi:histone demethylase JARID1